MKLLQVLLSGGYIIAGILLVGITISLAFYLLYPIYPADQHPHLFVGVDSSTDAPDHGCFTQIDGGFGAECVGKNVVLQWLLDVGLLIFMLAFLLGVAVLPGVFGMGLGFLCVFLISVPGLVIMYKFILPLLNSTHRASQEKIRENKWRVAAIVSAVVCILVIIFW